jgi:hypothetical protein
VQPASAVLDEHQHVQPPDQDGVNMKEVDGEDPGTLGMQELLPGRAVPAGSGIDAPGSDDLIDGRRRSYRTRPVRRRSTAFSCRSTGKSAGRPVTAAHHGSRGNDHRMSSQEVLSGTRPANHHHARPAAVTPGQSHDRVFGRRRTGPGGPDSGFLGQPGCALGAGLR